MTCTTIYTERSVARLAAAGLLDAGTYFFGDLRDLADLPVPARSLHLTGATGNVNPQAPNGI